MSNGARLFDVLINRHPDEVTMFVKPMCPRCVTWKLSLLEKGVAVRCIDISSSEYEDEFEELIDDLKAYDPSFPYCFYNGTYYGSEDDLQARLCLNLAYDMDF
jgi:glutaredoxin